MVIIGCGYHSGRSSHAIADDASRSGSADGTGLRVGDRNARKLPLRQAVGQLSLGDNLPF